MAGIPIHPGAAPTHKLPLSPAMRAGDTIYVSGTVAVDAQGGFVGVGDVALQTRCVLDQISEILVAAGGSLGDIVLNQVFLADLGDFRAMNAAYAEYFPGSPPARYCVQTPLVRREFLVEIASTAYLGDAAPGSG